MGGYFKQNLFDNSLEAVDFGMFLQKKKYITKF